MEIIYMSIRQVYLKLVLSEGMLRTLRSQLPLKLHQTLQPPNAMFSPPMSSGYNLPKVVKLPLTQSCKPLTSSGNAFVCWKADEMEYFNSGLVAYIPQMLKQERTPNNYTWFNNFRYDRAEQIMATGGWDGAYQQVIPYASGPMSCATHRWAIRRLNKFCSSCWGKTCMRQYFLSGVFHA